MIRPDDGGLFTRIDYMPSKYMEPYQLGFLPDGIHAKKSFYS